MESSLKKTLKAKAHNLNPVILLGTKGLTPAVIEETNQALLIHELIKIKMKGVEKADRTAITDKICQQLNAELVQTIGNIAVIYRENND